jgi:hypothetical protein
MLDSLSLPCSALVACFPFFFELMMLAWRKHDGELLNEDANDVVV